MLQHEDIDRGDPHLNDHRDHKTHMHVRFRCMPGNRRCYAHSVGSRPRHEQVVLANGPSDAAGDGVVAVGNGYDAAAMRTVHTLK